MQTTGFQLFFAIGLFVCLFISQKIYAFSNFNFNSESQSVNQLVLHPQFLIKYGHYAFMSAVRSRLMIIRAVTLTSVVIKKTWQCTRNELFNLSLEKRR